MTTAYDTLLASANPDFVVLVEPQPMEILASWTAAGGGLGNTYYCTFAAYVLTSVVGGGLYRRLDSVKQNTTALTSRASAALVNANLGSYFQDTANNRIYISTTSGVSPDTFSLIGAWFTLPLCDGGARINFSDQSVYYPIISGELPTIASEKPDPLFGVTMADQGSVAVLNGDGLFDRLSKQWVWRNKKVTFKLGGGSLAYSDFATIGVMRINNVQVDDESFTLQLEAMGSILNKAIVRSAWGDGTSTLTGPDPAILGKGQPILLGLAADIAPAFIGDVGGGFNQRYGVVDGTRAMTVLRVDAIARTTGVRTTLSLGGGDYSVGADYISILNATYTFTDYEIRAAVSDSAADDASGGATFGNAAYQLLIRAGEDAANIDSTTFTAMSAAFPDRLVGVYVDDTTTTAADVLRQLEQSVLGQVYIGSDGLWKCRIWDPSYPATYTLKDSDFATWKTDEDLGSGLSEVRVSRVTAWATDSVSEKSSSSLATQYANESSDRTTVQSVLLSDAQAEIMANHHRYLRSSPPDLIAFEERGLTLMGASVGDMVSVTRSRAPLARTGAYAGHLLMIQKIEKHLGPDCPKVTGVLNDLEGQTDRIFRLAPAASALTWATASDAERAEYGFLSDTNGYLDATDAQTRNGKVLY